MNNLFSFVTRDRITIGLYGLVHLLVDAVSVSMYFAVRRTFDNPYDVFLIYGLLAFATQAPFGLAADRINRPVVTAALGCSLVALSVFLVDNPVAALILVGIGNSLYHVGGGIVTLSLSGGRAAFSGVYVAPGTIGVAIGAILGENGNLPTEIFVSLLFAAALAILISGRSNWRVNTAFSLPESKTEGPSVFFYAMIFLCGTIALRSLIPQLVTDSTKGFMPWIFAIPVVVFSGKLFGGMLADRFGWHGFVLVTIILSAPTILIAELTPLAALPGLFLFTMTMPVTLVAISNLLPGKPGFAFGISALCFLLGVSGARYIPNTATVVFLGICLTACLFHHGLNWYNRRRESVRPDT